MHVIVFQSLRNMDLGTKKDSTLLSFGLTANGTILFENDVKQFNRQVSYNPAESIQDQIIGIKTS